MKKTIVMSMAAIFLFAGSCKKNEKTDTDETTTEVEKEEVIKETEEAKVIKVTLEARSGSKAEGEATFTQKDGKVTFEAHLTGLIPGEHAIHIHEKSDCSAPDGASTGGHWNPTNQQHGKWGSADGYHKGDIGNFVADENGNGKISLTTDEWCIGCDDETKNVVGKSVIVHTGADDFVTQPTGNAGGRVSCGGIIK